MPTFRRRLITLICTAAMVGCAPFAPPNDFATKPGQSAGDPDKACVRSQTLIENDPDLGDILDYYLCTVPAVKRPMRLYRAQLVITMFAHYGADRFPDYASDPSAQALKLLTKIERTSDLLVTALKASSDPDNLYEVKRTDLAVGIFEMVATDLEPTLRTVGGFLTSISPVDQLRNGKKLFINAVKNNLYLNAYRKDLADVISATSSASPSLPSAEAWEKLNDALTTRCTTLNALARTKTPIKCVSDGLKGAISAAMPKK